MRWVYLAVIVIFALAILVFALQNLEIVAISFAGLEIRAPLAIIAVVVYALGAVTGGSLYALLRKSIRESRSQG